MAAILNFQQDKETKDDSPTTKIFLITNLTKIGLSVCCLGEYDRLIYKTDTFIKSGIQILVTIT